MTGAELVERCRAVDPTTIPSTVYRTLDVLEELGLLSHSHAADGREEFNVLPVAVHSHLHCSSCGTTWEIPAGEAASLVSSLERSRGFAVDATHLSTPRIYRSRGAARCAQLPSQSTRLGFVGLGLALVSADCAGIAHAVHGLSAVRARAGPRSSSPPRPGLRPRPRQACLE